ncbi:MAG: hypothetical protein AAB456_03355, partial [Patescibacteria group bacterium]
MNNKIKIKIISFITLVLGLSFPTLTSAISLYDIFKGAIGYLPTIADRAPMALDYCGISDYTGTAKQNMEFLDCIFSLTDSEEQSIGGTVSKPYTFSHNTVIRSSEINSDYDTLYTLVNGNINDDNIVSNADIAATKISGTAFVLSPSSTQSVTATTTFTAPTFVSGTTAFFVVPKMTNTQRGNLVGVENGAIIYSNTNGQFYVYEGGAWAGITGSGETAIASTTAKGLVEIGTPIEIASSTADGAGSTNAWLVPFSEQTTSTPGYSCNSTAIVGALCIPVALNSGKLHQLWLDLSEAYIWTGGHTFANTTTTNSTSTNYAFTGTVSSTNFTLYNKNLRQLVNGTDVSSTMHTHY